jgi:hypothetical protein
VTSTQRFCGFPARFTIGFPLGAASAGSFELVRTQCVEVVLNHVPRFNNGQGLAVVDGSNTARLAAIAVEEHAPRAQP